MKVNPHPGEVYFVDLGMVEKPRDVLIVSIDDEAAPLAVVTALSLTTRFHQTPYEVPLPKLPWLRERSFVNAQSLSGYKFVELQRLKGRFDATTMRQVQAALRLWLGL
jgi:mRNA interferase MazF